MALWAAPLAEAPNPRLLQHGGSWWCAGCWRLPSQQFPMLLVHSACLRARGAERGGPPHVPCCGSAVPLCRAGCTRGASARCILTSKPLPASCRSLNPAPCLQLICLPALINRHHPFPKHQQVDTEPPRSLNPAPMPYRHALAWHGAYTRTFPRCLLPNAPCGKQTVSAHPCTPQKLRVSAMEMHRGGYNEDATVALVEKSDTSSAVISSLGWWPNSTENVVKFTLCT